MRDRRPPPRYRDVRPLFTIPAGSISKAVLPARPPERPDEPSDEIELSDEDFVYIG